VREIRMKKTKVEILPRAHCYNCDEMIYQCDKCKDYFGMDGDIIYCGMDHHFCERCGMAEELKENNIKDKEE
jgi:rRNA maturation endonuclease Nob1